MFDINCVGRRARRARGATRGGQRLAVRLPQVGGLQVPRLPFSAGYLLYHHPHHSRGFVSLVL
jgi:hypothetical protein